MSEHPGPDATKFELIAFAVERGMPRDVAESLPEAELRKQLTLRGDDGGGYDPGRVGGGQRPSP